jgi:hypothetical protein
MRSAAAHTNAFWPALTHLRSGRKAVRGKLTVLVALLAFALQSYVVQTHIHFQGNSDFGLAIAKNVAADAKAANTELSKHNQKPAEQDPAHCPICQEFLHAGQYLATPPVVALLLTVVVVPVAIVRDVFTAFNPVPHT